MNPKGASGSSTMIARLFVAAGGIDQAKSGETPASQANFSGIFPPSAKSALVTVSDAVPTPAGSARFSCRSQRAPTALIAMNANNTTAAHDNMDLNLATLFL